MTVTHIRVSGAPRERGLALGRQAKAQIHRSIEIYDETFRHYTGLGWDQVRARSEAYIPAINAYDPEIMSELEGTAEGAEVTLEDLLAVNARTEIMYGLSVQMRPECTAFAARSPATADQAVLLGQNWDWRPATAETCILLEVEPAGRPSFVTYVEAGLVAKIGFNSAGVGLMANLLITNRDRGAHDVPFHVILRGILTAPSFAGAIHAVTRATRAASANYLIASAHGELADLETGPGGPDALWILSPEDGVICHANTFCAPIDGVDVGLETLPDSPRRTERAAELLAAAHGHLDADRAFAMLNDHDGHPASICRHPNPDEHPIEQLQSNASVIVDLRARTLQVTAGPPCDGEPETITPAFAQVAVGAR